MRCGLYGKLPAKRDFVALAMPRELLAVWEPWLQGGVSGSRAELGPDWQAAFLRAPIWRFWLGQEVAGATTLGAFMPSVDGVGRYFPLTLFARPDPGEEIAPPELDANEAWLAEAEELLLSALAENASFEALSEAVGRSPGPAPASPGPAEPAVRVRGGALLAPVGEEGVGAAFDALRRLDHARAYGGTTCWWTLGGQDFPPSAIVCRRMPDPYLFTGMLTGRFEAAAA